MMQYSLAKNKYAWAIVTLAFLVFLSSFGFAGAIGYGGGQDRELICHKGRTLSVAEPAVQAHLNHGDHVGRCTIDDRLDRIDERIEERLEKIQERLDRIQDRIDDRLAQLEERLSQIFNFS